MRESVENSPEFYSVPETAENGQKLYSESEAVENETELYSVSEAVQRTGVPSHVLRYWEDELHLYIRRSAQGHRLYSAKNLETFRRVKELKEKGIQLKAIRLLLEDSEDGKQLERLLGKEVETALSSEEMTEETAARRISAEEAEPEYEIIPASESGNLQRFESIMRSLICEAVSEQNEKLEQDLSELIRDEFDDLYIQLQETAKREVAAAQMNFAPMRVRKGILQRLMDAIEARHWFC